ncbi:MarR family winged helix-turn-helix transcriptional regulator [Agromyces rhizosphaerae]|uniref:MarR family winged helix-turn-helix transcriptional regulator n=1 Tax=Agromyces rhizosphaerae TaxID=88374 RepID=UPI00248F9FDB|nr:MarR family winged helix-turn-helix transcriptional regulator [Agromyces rhizosphaerae]
MLPTVSAALVWGIDFLLSSASQLAKPAFATILRNRREGVVYSAEVEEFRRAAAEDVGHLLREALHVGNERFLELMSARGHERVAMRHLPVFGAVDRDGTRITVVASRTDISRQAVGQLIHELEALGYLTLTPDPSDRRAQIVRLTERGMSFCTEGAEAAQALHSEVVDRIGGEEALDALRAGLQRIIGDA